MTGTVQSLSNFWKRKHDCANIYKKKKEKKKKRTMCASSTFPICVTEHVSDFPLSNFDHKPMQRGEWAPVCVKNRTWYYRGISKRPVKIKGFREVLRSGFDRCQHFFGVCCLMWSVKNCFWFEEQHVTSPCSRKNDWRRAWKRETHSRTFVLHIWSSQTSI